MIENQPSSGTAHAKTRKVSIQERAVHVGNFVVVNGYRVHETKHFLLFCHSKSPFFRYNLIRSISL